MSLFVALSAYAITFTSWSFCLDLSLLDFGLYIEPLTIACAHSTNVVLKVEFPCLVIHVTFRLSPLDCSPQVRPVKDAYAFAFGNLLKSDVSTWIVIADVVSIPLKHLSLDTFSLYRSVL